MWNFKKVIETFWFFAFQRSFHNFNSLWNCLSKKQTNYETQEVQKPGAKSRASDFQSNQFQPKIWYFFACAQAQSLQVPLFDDDKLTTFEIFWFSINKWKVILEGFVCFLLPEPGIVITNFVAMT